MEGLQPDVITTVELTSLSDFQVKLYSSEDGKEVPSRHSYNYKKSNWSTPITAMFQKSLSGDNCTYSVDSRYHYLINTYLTADIPSVRVKDEYVDKVQIKLCKNLFHHIIKSRVLSIGKNPKQVQDRYSSDIYMCYYPKTDYYKRMIGNGYYTDNWCSSIEVGSISCPQRWFFDDCCGCYIRSKDNQEKASLPIHLCDSNITFNYRFNLDMRSFIIMRILDEEGSGRRWKVIDVDTKYIEMSCSDYQIKMPDMWGRLDMLTGEELQWRSSLTTRIMFRELERIKYNTVALPGSTHNIDIVSTYPIVAIHWMIENLTSRSVNIRSNYSCDPVGNMYIDPCSNSSMSYASITRSMKRSAAHTTSIEGYYSMPCDTSPSGINTISFSSDINSLDVVPSSSKGGVLSLWISSDDKQSKYKIRVYVTVIKELSYSSEGIDISGSNED